MSDDRLTEYQEELIHVFSDFFNIKNPEELIDLLNTVDSDLILTETRFVLKIINLGQLFMLEDLIEAGEIEY